MRNREQAAHGLNSVENLVDSLMQQKQLLLRVLTHRIDAEKYNAATAEVSWQVWQLADWIAIHSV